jgi:ArsR family transcriptional regulator
VGLHMPVAAGQDASSRLRHVTDLCEDNDVASGNVPELSAAEVQAIARVLADPRRFEILKHIASNTSCPCSDLRTEFPIAPATLSHHLKELEQVGLLEFTRRGKFMDLTFRRSVWNAYVRELKKL